jgi:hypothetical protein
VGWNTVYWELPRLMVSFSSCATDGLSSSAQLRAVRIIVDITTPCMPVNVNWSFGGPYHLHLQGKGVSQGMALPDSSWFLFWHILRPWIWSSETSVIFHRIRWRCIPEDIFIVTAMGISNQVWCLLIILTVSEHRSINDTCLICRILLLVHFF